MVTAALAARLAALVAADRRAPAHREAPDWIVDFALAPMARAEDRMRPTQSRLRAALAALDAPTLRECWAACNSVRQRPVPIPTTRHDVVAGLALTPFLDAALREWLSTQPGAS